MIRDLAVPTLSRGLFVAERYCSVLAKEAIDGNVSLSSLLDARLSDDAPTFLAHIDGAMDVARTGLVALLDFPELLPAPADHDLPGVRSRLVETINYVGQADGVVFIDTDQKVEYVVQSMLPAFYLHLASAHAILRSIGAPVGKRDYLGDLTSLYAPSSSKRTLR